MVGGTRSGWTAAAGHIPQPNLNAPAAVQRIFYENEFFRQNNSREFKLWTFSRPESLRQWATMGAVSQRRAERAFWKVNQLEIMVHTNWPDRHMVNLAVGIAPPAPGGNVVFNGMVDFKDQMLSRRTQRFTPTSDKSFTQKSSLLRNAKTAGTFIRTAPNAVDQAWLETRGEIFREVLFTGKYHSHSQAVPALPAHLNIHVHNHS